MTMIRSRTCPRGTRRGGQSRRCDGAIGSVVEVGVGDLAAVAVEQAHLGDLARRRPRWRRRRCRARRRLDRPQRHAAALVGDHLELVVGRRRRRRRSPRAPTRCGPGSRRRSRPSRRRAARSGPRRSTRRWRPRASRGRSRRGRGRRRARTRPPPRRRPRPATPRRRERAGAGARRAAERAGWIASVTRPSNPAGGSTAGREQQQLVGERREALDPRPALGAVGEVLERPGAVLAVGDPERDLGAELVQPLAVGAHRCSLARHGPRRRVSRRPASGSRCGSGSSRCRAGSTRSRRSRAR